MIGTPRSPTAGSLTPAEQVELAKAKRLPPIKNPVVQKAVQKRKEEMSYIMKFATSFLNATANKNIISIHEFEQFIPLFRRADLDRMSDEAKSDLTYQYAQRINPQQPVIVIDPENEDAENGIMYKGHKCKVVCKLPAWYNRLDAVNAQGSEALSTAAEYLANARSTSNPFDNRLMKYSGELGGLIHKGNVKNVQAQEAERSKISAGLGSIVRGNPAAVPGGAGSGKASEKSSKKTVVQNEPESLDADWED